jgi:hypothetical protein
MFLFVCSKTAIMLFRKIQKITNGLTIDAATPFVQQPPVQGDAGATEKSRIKASDLFSLFTADIIKERIIFTR